MGFQEALANNFFSNLRIEVQWGDMDAASHVNNVTYLRWFESARIKYFMDLGINLISPENEVDFILGWQECKYIFPVTFPDTVHIGISITEIREDRVLMEAHMFSQKYERLIAIARGHMVTYDYKQLKKVNLPDYLAEEIRQKEKLSS